MKVNGGTMSRITTLVCIVLLLVVLQFAVAVEPDIHNSGNFQLNRLLNQVLGELNEQVIPDLNAKYFIQQPNQLCTREGAYPEKPVANLKSILDRGVLTFCEFYSVEFRPPYLLSNTMGYSVDLASEIVNRIGGHYSTNMTYSLVTVRSTLNFWGELTRALGRQCDVILAEVVESSSRNSNAMPTCAYSDASLVFVTYNRPNVTLEQINTLGTTVGVPTYGLVTTTEFPNDVAPRALLQFYTGRTACYEDLRRGQIDALYDTRPYAENTLRSLCPSGTDVCSYRVVDYSSGRYVMYTQNPSVDVEPQASTATFNSLSTTKLLVPFLLFLILVN